MASAPIRSVIEEGDVEEKLLNENNKVLIVPNSVQDEGGILAVKSSKKVKLPEDEGTVGGRFTIGPAPERDWEMVPPDGKWGWCVLVGATLVNILIPGTIKSFGVLLVEFNDVFHSSPSAASGIVALCYFLYSSLGPLSSILSVKWSYRTVTLIGGSFAAFGMIFSSCAFSITYLYFSFGAMVGTGAGLAFPPTVYIVTSYFVRLRGLANGICMSGSAFGSIILPPVLRYLLETYGYKGAVLILGGIMLNVWAAALLFQPVEEHLVKKYKEPEEDEEVPQGDILFEEEEPIDNAKVQENMPRILTNGSIDLQKNLSQTNVNSQNCIPSFSSQNQLRHNMSKKKLSRPVSRVNNSSASIAHDIKRLGSQETFGRRLSTAGPKRNMSTSSFAYVSTPFHGSTLSAFEQPNEFASQFSLKSVTESVADVAYCCFCCKKKERKEPNKFFDLSLLTDPSYLVILISSSTVAISCTNFIILLPSHAQNIGFDKAQGAYLLSTVSALDLVGRIGGSALCDLNLIPKSFYFVGGLLFSGLALVVMPFLSTYVGISVCCAFFGLASGVNNSVTTLVMAEVLGVERLMSTYGISLFVNGILQLIGPPLCGLWFELDHNYNNMFISFGFIFIGGASLWILMPFINKRKKKAGVDLETFAEEDPTETDEFDHPKLLSPEDTPHEKHNGSPPIFKNKSNANFGEDSPNKQENFVRSASAAQVSRDNDKTRKVTPVSSKHGLQNVASKNHLPSNLSLLESVPEGKTSRVNSTEAFGKKLTIPKTPKRSPSTSSFQYMSTPFHGSTLSAFEKPSEFASQFSLKSITESLAPITYCCGCKKRPKDDNAKKEPSKYFDVQLLKDPIYLVILISNCTCAISYTNFIILVPSYAQELGFDKSLGAYLLSIISALDLVGRIGGSALSDVVTTPKRYFFIFGLLLSGISLAMLPLVSSYSAISAFCSIFGIASGINVGVTALVMTEMLGTERLMSSYGISLFMNGILQLIGPPICGFWFEYTKSYKSLFVTLGFILVGGAALWGFVPLINRRRRLAERRKESEKA
ncbi:unnamed protein product [Diatraea saccharalis]|uniref:Major facilitator superfamily (MFS) profile domain-containing protein n=1 Tax=Diatraea saccharalis TaxID=40085 RepID=A0A9N9R5B1_9NEOP|nr:unnamed protein product [Diatraea saccharalis]